MAGFERDVLVCENVNFSPSSAKPHTGIITLNGQLMIGSTGAPNIRAGFITSPDSSILITNGPGTIKLQAAGTIATTYITDAGSTQPVSNQLTIIGAGGATTSVGPAGTITITAGGGGGGVSTLTPNDAIPVTPTAGTIPVIGQPANTVDVIYTTSTVNKVNIEDRTYLSQYVVDLSTTPGLKGTFQTIQDALDQIVIDGTGVTPLVANIIIRPGTYAADITVATGQNVNFNGVAIQGKQTFSVPCVNIEGNVTVPDTSNVQFSNIHFQPAMGPEVLTFTGAPGATFNFCNFSTPMTVVSGVFEFNNCLTFDITDSADSSLTFNECESQGTITTFQATAIFNYCKNVILVLTDFSNSIFNFCNIYNISGTGNVITINSCSLSNPITATCSVNYENISAEAAGGPINFFNGPTNLVFSNSSQGNVIDTKYSNTDYTFQTYDYSVAITDTSAPRTVYLPNASAICKQQSYIIVDESGGAGTNNITVQPLVGLINGAASIVISKNYGSVTAYNDGTNWFTIVDDSSSGGGGGGITTINGDSGSITGATVTIYANQAGNNSGASVAFVNSGTTSTFNVSDSSDNTFIGNAAGAVATGLFRENCAFGRATLPLIVTGNDNLAIGFNSLGSLTDGSDNVGMGAFTLNGLVNGSNNLAYGSLAGSQFSSNESNNISIGAQGLPGENNRIRIGDRGTHTTAFIQGVDGVTVSNAAPVVINTATGQLGQGVASSGITWTAVTSASNPVSLVNGNGYIATGAGVVNFVLPATSSVGDYFRIAGVGNLWTLTQNAGQSVKVGFVTSTIGVGGSVTATMSSDCIELLAVVANTQFIELSMQGNPTIV